MNSNQAKHIPLSRILSLLGFDPQKTERGGQEKKYFSPFRSEGEPSFNFNLVKNAWYDFGLSQGGNTLDFALIYVQQYGIGSNVSDALRWLEGLTGGRGVVKVKTHQPKLKLKEDKSKLELIKVTAVKNKQIRSYLVNERKIAPDLIDLYTKEIRYRNLNKDKIYFGYGMENLSGGYEIRVAFDDYSFKSAINGRDISLIKGQKPDSGKVNIFEGTTDFLSLLTLLKAKRLTADTIIMHSLSSYQRTLSYIKEKKYKLVNTFLDNNNPGKDHTDYFRRDLGKEVVNDQAYRYLPCEDVNDMLRDYVAGKVKVDSLYG